MIRFARLFAAIDQTNSTNAKIAAMADYFRDAPPADAAWGVFFLTGRRLKRLVPYMAIYDWTVAATGLDGWMIEECYAVVGDGAETAALMMDQLPAGLPEDLSLAEWVEGRILPLRQMAPDAQEEQVMEWMRHLDRWTRFTLLKLLTGELRVGVSQTLVVRALAAAADLPATTIAARLMGDWTPSVEWYQSLFAPGVTSDDLSRPYPFCLASPVESSQVSSELLGDLAAWQIEWKWDGIRAQIVKRGGQVHVWSRGEELITDRFPEVVDVARALPDGTVLDGEILAFQHEQPLPFSALQHRIGRRKQVARLARDVPVVFMAYDALEEDGVDIRAQPLSSRRAILEGLIGSRGVGGPAVDPGATSVTGAGDRRDTTAAAPARATRRTMHEPLLPFDGTADDLERRAAGSPGALRGSPLLAAESWEALGRLRCDSRSHGVEGVMLKRLESAYLVGRKRGDWWKWKIDPFTIDAVLIYAQPGSGKRASLLTDYTFGLWDNGELVPVAKAYSGLSNEEIAEMDRWIRRHTVERFGPVRHVEPVHVFELGFEAIARSTRHRSGVAVRFPRMLRWRKDKPAAEADTLDALRAMIPDAGSGRT